MAASVDITTRQGETYVSDTYVWQTPDNKTVQHLRLKWRAGFAPGASSPLSLSDGAGITITSSVPGKCVFYYTIPAATLLAIAAANYVYDVLADNSDSTTDCVIGESIVTHQQVMTQ